MEPTATRLINAIHVEDDSVRPLDRLIDRNRNVSVLAQSSLVATMGPPTQAFNEFFQYRAAGFYSDGLSISDDVKEMCEPSAVRWNGLTLSDRLTVGWDTRPAALMLALQGYFKEQVGEVGTKDFTARKFMN